MATKYGYGSPNNATPPSQPKFEREVDKFGISVANANQGTSLVDSTEKHVDSISQAKNSIMKRNLIDNSMYAEPAKIPEGMPDHMKAIVKATDFDPMNTGSVKELQERLNQSGYADSTGQPLKVDGRFGPKTAIAKLGLELDAENAMNMSMQELQQHQAKEEYLRRQQEPIAPPMQNPIVPRTSTYYNYTKYKDEPHFMDPAPTLQRNNPYTMKGMDWIKDNLSRKMSDPQLPKPVERKLGY